MINSVINKDNINTRGVAREYIYFGLIILTNAMLAYYCFCGAVSPLVNEFKYGHDIAIGLGAMFILIMISHLFFMGYIRGNAIKVTSKQFSEVYEIIENQARLLGFRKTPTLYLLNGNGVLNAFATKFGMRNYLIIYSSVFELAYKEGKEALEFIIGHELGHLKRGHASFIKMVLQIPTMLVPFLNKAYSRACEYSCDRIGSQLCHDGATKGLLILASGTELFGKINLNEYLIDSKKDRGFITWLHDIFSTHPSLSKRIEEVNKI